MNLLYSRRCLIGALASATLTHSAGYAANDVDTLSCNCSRDDFDAVYNTRTSTSGNVEFDEAIIVELKNIRRVIPSINPGYQYVKANNSFTTSHSVIRNTKGTVWIGLELVNNLIDARKKDRTAGGTAVAGVLAHECAHIYQINSGIYDRMIKDRANPALVELHADFIAGYYLAYKNGVRPEHLPMMQGIFVYLSTYDPKDPKYHGTPGLRAAALDAGYFVARDKKRFVEASEYGEKYVRNLVW